jgi:hypothetical protein
MAYFDHRFETVVSRHPVGRYHDTVVVLPAPLATRLPFHESARLRIEADVSGIPVKGAWQPAQGRWFLMPPKAALEAAGLGVGSTVEVSFRLAPPDEVDLPAEIASMLEAEAAVRTAWQRLSADTQCGLAHWVASARKAETRQARLAEVRAVVLGEAPAPWKRRVAVGGRPVPARPRKAG